MIRKKITAVEREDVTLTIRLCKCFTPCRSVVQCSAVQCSAVQCSVLQCIAMESRVMKRRTVQ